MERKRKTVAQDAIKAQRYADQIFEFSGKAANSQEHGMLVTNPSDSHRTDHPHSGLKNMKHPDDGVAWRPTKFSNKRNKIIERKIRNAVNLEDKTKVKSFKDTPSGREFEIIMTAA